MNLKPKNYEWIDFYDKVIDLTEYTFSKKAIYRRFKSTSQFTSKWMNFMRAISSEGYGRIRFYKSVRKHLKEDASFRAYFEGETRVLPEFYTNIIREDLGIWWQWLPKEALDHNENAYLHKNMNKEVVKSKPGKIQVNANPVTANPVNVVGQIIDK